METERLSSDADLGWLLGASLRAYLSVAEEAVEAIPFGFRGYTVLAAVGRWCPGSQLELGRRLGIDKTVMTHVIDSLEERGLVARRPGPGDRRARRVELTAEGRLAWEEASARLSAEECRLLDGLPAGKREALVEALTFLAGEGGSGPQCGELSGEAGAPCPGVFSGC